MPLLDSFKVDHTRMNAPAVRVAKTMRTPKGDDITVFDLRFCIPNKEILPPKGIHTLEHLFAGFMRDHLNNDNVEIIDISPMGCRTGFYLLTRNLSNENAIKLVKDSFKFISEFEGTIPGTTIEECGNYLEHDLESARKDVLPLLEKLQNYTPEMLDYSWHYGKEIE